VPLSRTDELPEGLSTKQHTIAEPHLRNGTSTPEPVERDLADAKDGSGFADCQKIIYAVSSIPGLRPLIAHCP